MAGIRKLAEPIYVENAFTFPTPEPVLTNEHRVDDGMFLTRTAYDELVTADDLEYDPAGIRYLGSAFAGYYNRVYVIPRTLSLVDPENGAENTFYLWNANFGTVELDDIDAENNTGLDLSFDVGLSISDLELKTVNVVVTPAAPVAVEASYLFTFDNGSLSPFTIILLRTNLLLVVPETPVREQLSWKTNIITARDGTEQRYGVRQIARRTLTYKMIFSTAEEERDIYEKLLSKGDGVFSIPVWFSPIRVLSDSPSGAAAVNINTDRYDVQAEDQFYYELDDGTYDIFRVQSVVGNVVNLYTTLAGAVTTATRLYRVLPVYLPQRPSLRRGAYQHLETTLELRVTTPRDLFTGEAETVEIGSSLQLRDRVLSATVYTLGGVPIMNARPMIEGTVEETFEWDYEVIDYETGVFEQSTTKDEASVIMERFYLVKNLDQWFFYNFVLDYMHGQRKPIWLPTWQKELSDRVSATTSTTITISDERYADDFPADSSHRGLWIRHTSGWLARRLTAVEKDGQGNTVLTVEPPLPLDFPQVPPFEMGFLVLARLGSDDVQIDHQQLYSLLNMQFMSTGDTSEGV
jgi:hypothetical protein